MPIRIPDSLPARGVLESENIFVMTEFRAMHQDIRPLKLLILNLMPTKVVTENQLLRKLSNTPLQIDVEFLQTASYIPKHVDIEHLESFYTTFDQVKDKYYDGLIITGAPLADVAYEDVEYWPELTQIMDWAETNVHCTMYICWGALAGMYYYYGVPTVRYDEKLSGIYPNRVLKRSSPFLRGFDDVFMAPHSREVGVLSEDVLRIPELEILSDSETGGPTFVKTTDSSKFFIFCHLEYDIDTLALEYKRDLDKGMNPNIPVNYFPDDNPRKKPVVNWRSAGQLMFSNWLNYYVYQSTPFELGKKHDKVEHLPSLRSSGEVSVKEEK